MGINGEGIGYYKRKPVFIDGAIIGEEVKAKITEDHGRYMRAKLISVNKVSPDRVRPRCIHYEDCGACQVMHMRYEAQLAMKLANLKEALYKYTDVEIDDIKIIRADKTLAYRNTAKTPVKLDNKGKLYAGLYRASSDRLIDTSKCLVHRPEIVRTIKNIINVLNKYKYKKVYALEVRSLGDNLQIVIETAEDLSTSCLSDLSKIEGLISLATTGKRHRNSTNVKYKNLLGDGRISFECLGLDLEISEGAFYQRHTEQAEKLYGYATSFIDENDKLVFEAYCGIGVMSLLTANKVKEVIGVEIVPSAIRNAKANAIRNNITNTKFYQGDSAEVLKRVAREQKIDAIIADPPRTGLDKAMKEGIIKSKANKFIYVSCNEATFAKDLAELIKYYDIKDIVAIDMFPETSHIEMVAHLVLRD